MAIGAGFPSTIEGTRGHEPSDAINLVFLVSGGSVFATLQVGSSLSVGRDARADVVLEDPTVSRIHARLSFVRGRLTVQDLDSRNGVWINGNRVSVHSLGALDQARFGGVPMFVSARAVPLASAVRPAESAAAPAQQLGRGAADQVGAPPGVVWGAATAAIFELAARARRADLPVLIIGETGVGKEVIARAFHGASTRADEPFFDLNCGAIPASLAASTFFGHERGAFTGADARARGAFEEAHRGTLFLDEVGELSLDAQAALLRVLEQKQVYRVGSGRPIPVDVRIIAATHRPLEDYVRAGRFRADLLYRLAGLTVHVPPLRERRDEIAALSQLFLTRAAERWNAPARRLSPGALAYLVRAPWPGNARELRNAIERAVAVSTNTELTVNDLSERAIAPLPEVAQEGPTRAQNANLRDVVRAYEATRLRAALDAAGGNRSEAARRLGVPRRTLGTKLRLYGID